MKKIHVPRCRINENLFIIDSTPTEDAADNRFGLNSEKTVTLLAIALQCLLVLTCRNCQNCQKILIALRCYKMKKIHVPRCRINENLFIIDSTPTEDSADNRFGLNSEKKKLRADNHSFFLTFDPEVILAPPGANCENKPELSAPDHFGTGIFYICAISMMDNKIL